MSETDRPYAFVEIRRTRIERARIRVDYGQATRAAGPMKGVDDAAFIKAAVSASSDASVHWTIEQSYVEVHPTRQRRPIEWEPRTDE